MTGLYRSQTDKQRIEAMIAILEICSTTREEMNAVPLSEILLHPKLDGLSKHVVRCLVNSLTTAELLWRPPHLATRSARYVTTAMGKVFISQHCQNGSD